MSYVALYREWRPQTFGDIVGQEHISKTLQNAIAAERIAHAYLFCGPRGTGKTTTAKVLAKAVNCLDRDDSEPCNKCDNCTRITEGTSMDVMEIDAASNRGIDEIRDLREKVKFSPTEGKFRIYIIDEVHMLTTEAFNALLKTLEEPPGHVIFVLATTEPHKIPNTILSRCQRFDFKRITTGDIAVRLREICQELEIQTDEETLNLLAKTADGGLRDALSILDQCIAFSGKKVTIDEVNIVLGTVDQEILFKMTECFVGQDTTSALFLIDQIVNKGKDLRQFCKDLTEHLRNLLLCQVSDKAEELIPATEHTLNMLKEQSKKIKRGTLIKLLNVFSSVEREIKWSNQPRLNMELALIDACSTGIEYTTEELIDRITKLENIIAAGGNISPLNQRAVANNDKAIKQQQRTESLGVADKGVRNKTETKLSNTERVIEIETVKNNWQEIMERLKNIKRTVHAFLKEGEPLDVSGNNLVLGFMEEYEFHKENIEKAENRTLVENTLRDVFGCDIFVKCTFSSQYHNPAKQESNEPEEENPFDDFSKQFFAGEVIEFND